MPGYVCLMMRVSRCASLDARLWMRIIHMRFSHYRLARPFRRPPCPQPCMIDSICASVDMLERLIPVPNRGPTRQVWSPLCYALINPAAEWGLDTLEIMMIPR